MFSRISPSRSYDSMDVCNACPLAKSAGAFFPEPGVSSSSRSTFLIGEVNNLRQVSVGLDGIKSKSVVREVLFEKSFSRSSVREVLSVFPKAEIKCDPRFKCRWLLGQCSEIECQKANFSLSGSSQKLTSAMLSLVSPQPDAGRLSTPSLPGFCHCPSPDKGPDLRLESPVRVVAGACSAQPLPC